MSLRDPLEFLQYEDLPEELQEVAHYCSMEVVKQMLRYVRSGEIPVPKLKNLSSLCERYIREEHNGRNVKQLAAKLGVSREFVRQRLRR